MGAGGTILAGQLDSIPKHWLVMELLNASSF
jgi:hypothetical protein